MITIWIRGGIITTNLYTEAINWGNNFLSTWPWTGGWSSIKGGKKLQFGHNSKEKPLKLMPLGYLFEDILHKEWAENPVFIILTGIRKVLTIFW